MIKRISAICFVFLLIFSPEVPAAERNEDAAAAYELFTALEFELPATELSEKVSYNDFLYMLLRLFGVDSAGSEYNFRVSLAQARGILPAGAASDEGAYVTFSAAAAMSVAAAGYAPEAQALGGYPTGYIITANRLGIAGAFANEEFITLGSALIMLEELGNVDMRRQTGFGGENSYAVIKGFTPFYEYHKAYKIRGVIEKDEYSSLYNPNSALSKGKIQINEKCYAYEGDYTLGAGVEGYAAQEDTGNIILCLRAWRTKSIVIKSEDIQSAEAGRITYTDNGRTCGALLENPAAVIYNGKAFPEYSAADFKPADGSLLLIDNDGDGVYDIVHIRQRTTIFINTVDAQEYKIYDKNGLPFIDLSMDNAAHVIWEDGNKINIGRLRAQNVLSVYTSKDGLLSEIFTSSFRVSGIIEEIGGDKSITISGKRYTYNSYFEKYYLPKIRPGAEISAVTDEDGRITAAPELSAAPEYALLIGFYAGEGFAKPQMKLFTKNNEIKIYNIADKINVNNFPYSREELQHEFGMYTVGNEQLIRFRTSGINEISEIITETVDTAFITDEVRESSLVRYPATGNFDAKGNRFDPDLFFMNRSTVNYFRIIDDSGLKEEERYAFGTIHESGKRYSFSSFKIYNINKMKSADAVVYTTTSSSALDAQSSSGIVVSVSEAIVPNDENEIRGIKLTIVDNRGAFKELYVEEGRAWESIPKAAPEDKYPLCPGDYIRYATDANNNIHQLAKDFEYKTKSILYPSQQTLQGRRYYQGSALRITGSFLTIAAAVGGNTPDTSDESSYSFVALPGTFVIFDTEKSDVIHPAASSGQLVTSDGAPGNEDYVLVYTYDTYSPVGVIYR